MNYYYSILEKGKATTNNMGWTNTISCPDCGLLHAVGGLPILECREFINELSEEIDFDELPEV